MRLTLQNKFVALTTILVVALILAGTLLTESRQRGAIAGELQKRALTIARSVAASTVEAFPQYDFVTLERAVTLAARDADVAYIVAHDKEGRIAAHSHRRDLVGRPPQDPIAAAALAAREPLLQSYPPGPDDPPIAEAAVPVVLAGSAEKWGTVRVGLSSASVVREVRRTRWQLAGLGLAAALVAGLGAVAVARRITHPLRQLRDGVAAVGRGELDRRIEVKTRDEIRELAQAFNETTEKLARLRELEERLQRSSRLAALGTMAAGLAHDIRNPLTAVRMMCRVMSESHEDPSTRERFDQIVPRELDRVSGVIEDMLDLARPPELQLEPVDIDAAVAQGLDLFEQACQAQGIEVRREFSPGLPRLLGDEKRILRALTNIIQNAVQAMPRGGRLTVETALDHPGSNLPAGPKVHGEPGASRAIRIVLSDTGAGIARELLPHIFDPFFSTKPKGLGLGMAITHRVVEDHRGTIDVLSEPGQGTTVVLRFPLGPAPDRS
jgi:signal transduction histidine kinase